MSTWLNSNRHNYNFYLELFHLDQYYVYRLPGWLVSIYLFVDQFQVLAVQKFYLVHTIMYIKEKVYEIFFTVKWLKCSLNQGIQ